MPTKFGDCCSRHTILWCARAGVISGVPLNSTGMALRTPSPLHPAELVQVALFLPGTGQAVSASGTVVWDDKHGKTGINFQCSMPRGQSELDAWLNTRFYELLTPRHSIL
jgi:hypothetical protein